jgi:hypothetical protein
MTFHNVVKYQQTVTFVTKRIEYMEVIGRHTQSKVI